METNRYNHTKIYKIVDELHHKFYIGSTCDVLSKRLYQHKMKAKREPERKVYKYFNDIGWVNVKIILMEEHNLESKEQQLREEDRIIMENIKDENCLNSLRAYRGYDKNTYNREKYKENREEWLDRVKQYYKDNTEKIKAYHKQYNIDNLETIRQRQHDYNQLHAEQNRERSKKHYIANRERNLESHICQCGGTYTRMGKNRHERTKKHQAYLTNQQLIFGTK